MRFKTRSEAERVIGENASLRGFEEKANVKPMRLVWYDSQFGAMFDCVVIYTDQKLTPERADYHERSLSFHTL